MRAIKRDLVEFKVQCLKVFCYHGNKSTILLFYSIFRTTPEVSSKLYFVEICPVSEKLWLFNHKRADFWLPNFGFKRSLHSLLNSFIVLLDRPFSISPWLTMLLRFNVHLLYTPIYCFHLLIFKTLCPRFQ